jgi:WD40 repeat protein
MSVARQKRLFRSLTVIGTFGLTVAALPVAAGPDPGSCANYAHDWAQAQRSGENRARAAGQKIRSEAPECPNLRQSIAAWLRAHPAVAAGPKPKQPPAPAAVGAAVTLAGYENADSAIFSPDGARILTLGRNGDARVWDAASGRLLFAIDDEPRDGFSAFSANASRILIASKDGSARVWDAADGLLVSSFNVGHTGDFSWYGAMSSNGSRVVTWGSDDPTRVWDASTGRLVLTLVGHRSTVNDAAFSRDDSRILTASLDGTARVWDAIDGRVLATLQGHENSVGTATFSPDGARIVTNDGQARVWDSSDGHLLTKIEPDKGSYFLSAILSPDGSQIATTSFHFAPLLGKHSASVWSVANGNKIFTVNGLTEQTPRIAVAYSPDGKNVIINEMDISFDVYVRIFDANSGRMRVKLPGSAIEGSSALSSDEKRIIIKTVRKGNTIHTIPY